MEWCKKSTPDNVKVRSDVLSDESNTGSVGLQGASSLTVSGLAYSNSSIDLLAHSYSASPVTNDGRRSQLGTKLR
jgi:hypothetical protein